MSNARNPSKISAANSVIFIGVGHCRNGLFSVWFSLFGAKLETFSSFFKALRVVLLMSVGKSINNVEVNLQYPVFGPLLLFLYLVVILFVLINTFVAVLVDSYAEIKEKQGDCGFVDAELGTFMFDVFLKKVKELPVIISLLEKSYFLRKCR